MTTRMPNPSAVPLVSQNGRMTTEWVRWFAEFEASTTASPPPVGSSVTLTGDVTGSGTGTVATQIAATGVAPGAYTNPSLTIGADGRVTAAASGPAPSPPSAPSLLDDQMPLPQEPDLGPVLMSIDALGQLPSYGELSALIQQLAARVVALEQGP